LLTFREADTVYAYHFSSDKTYHITHDCVTYVTAVKGNSFTKQESNILLLQK